MLGDAHDQSQVGFDELVLGAATVVHQPGQFALVGRITGAGVVALQQPCLSEEPHLDAASQIDLLLGVEQGSLADAAQVITESIR